MSRKAAAQVVGRADGVDVAGQVEVELLHGDDLAVAAAGRAALDAEDRARATAGGCRSTARCPMRFRPCARPTVVVVLPSPSGVGVIAVTTMYRPRRPAAPASRSSRSIASSRTLAFVGRTVPPRRRGVPGRGRAPGSGAARRTSRSRDCSAWVPPGAAPAIRPTDSVARNCTTTEDPRTRRRRDGATARRPQAGAVVVPVGWTRKIQTSQAHVAHDRAPRAARRPRRARHQWAPATPAAPNRVKLPGHDVDAAVGHRPRARRRASARNGASAPPGPGRARTAPRRAR